MIGHLWSAMWPNVFAPSAWTLLSLAAHHVLLRRQSREEHQETRAHVTRATGGEADGN